MTATKERKPTIVRRMLPVPMTPDELERADIAVATGIATYCKLEDEKKAATADLTRKMKEERKAYERIAKQRASRMIEKLVDCEQTPNLVKRVFEVHRIDTGEVVETRAMTGAEFDEERQTDIKDVIVRADDKAPELLGPAGPFVITRNDKAGRRFHNGAQGWVHDIALADTFETEAEAKAEKPRGSAVAPLSEFTPPPKDVEVKTEGEGETTKAPTDEQVDRVLVAVAHDVTEGEGEVPGEKELADKAAFAADADRAHEQMEAENAAEEHNANGAAA